MEQIDEQYILSFLLGQLPEENRVTLEERLFKDDGFYQEVLAAQEELADDYVQNNLSSTQRTQFEQNFLRSPLRRERLQFAAAFSGALVAPEKPSAMPSEVIPWWQSWMALFRPRWTLAACAVVVVLMIGAGLLVFENHRLSQRIEQAQGEKDSLNQQAHIQEVEETRKAVQLEKEIAALRAQGLDLQVKLQQKERELEELHRGAHLSNAKSSSGAIATFVLPAGLTRDGNEPQKLVIPATVQSIRLQLELERAEDYKTYLAEIRTARGNLVWSRRGLTLHPTTHRKAVSLAIPASLLPTGEYEITLNGEVKGRLEAVGYYYFLAQKK